MSTLSYYPTQSHLLTEALMAKNITAVRELLEGGCHVDTLLSSRQTPLFYACSIGDEEMVKFLIEQGADVNAVDITRTSAGMLACGNGRVEILRTLIAAGFQLLSECDNQGCSPAYYAAQNGHISVLDVLHEHGAHMTTSKDGSALDPAEVAAGLGQWKVLAWYQENGFPINAADLQKRVKDGLAVSSRRHYYESQSPSARLLKGFGVSSRMHADTLKWLTQQCAHCHQFGADKKCSGCQRVLYCR